MEEYSKIRDKIHSRYFLCGVTVSSFCHVFLFVIIAGNLFGLGRSSAKNVIYSVTLESGDKLGGISQVPDKNKKSEKVSPHKKVKEANKTEQIKKKAEQPKENTEQVKIEEDPKKEEKKLAPEKKVKEPEKENVIKEKKEKPEPPKKEEPKKEAPKKQVPKKKESSKKETKKTSPKKSKLDAKKKALANINKSYEEALQRYSGESTNAGGQGFGSTGQGGKGMGGGVQKPPEWHRYARVLEAYIKEGWNWHDRKASILASTSFKISKQGIISNIRLVESSGNPLFDDSVLRAISKASPVPAPPPRFYEDFKFIVMDFKPEQAS